MLNRGPERLLPRLPCSNIERVDVRGKRVRFLGLATEQADRALACNGLQLRIPKRRP